MGAGRYRNRHAFCLITLLAIGNPQALKSNPQEFGPSRNRRAERTVEQYNVDNAIEVQTAEWQHCVLLEQPVDSDLRVRYIASRSEYATKRR